MRRLRTPLRNDSKRLKVVENAINYFCLHRDHMCYPDFVAMGLPIGSGTIEDARQEPRTGSTKHSGWSRSGGQHVLDLRAYLKSGKWDSMWSALNRAA